jgi:cytosine/uracil/thiamine/allantoin permease
MTDEDRIKNIEELKEKILADKEMDADRNKDTVRGLNRSLEALSRSDEYYAIQRMIKKIETRIATTFALIFLITFFISAYGVPGIMNRSSGLIMYIAMISFALWLSASALAPRIFKLSQRFSKPKSS